MMPTTPDGLLAVTCWCEATVVHCTPDEVWAGRTRPCCRHLCRWLAERAGATS